MTDFSDRDIDVTVSQFEAAASAHPVDLPQLEIGRILLALDGSNQDRAVLDLGRAIAARLGSGVLLTYAYEEVEAPEKDSYLAEQARGFAGKQPSIAQARAGRAYARILELVRAHGCDLIALPSPYLEDFRDLGRASVGSTTDILLHRRAAPLLIVRKPAETVRDRLEHIVLPLNLLSSRGAEAAAWALQLVPPGGTIHLLAVVDEEMLDAVRHLPGEPFRAADLDETMLAGLGKPHLAGLVAVVQRRAAEIGVQCRVTVRHGALVATVAEFANAEPHLVIVGCSDESSAFQQALALVRASTNPVLAV